MALCIGKTNLKKENEMKKKLTVVVFICMTVMFVSMSFVAAAPKTPETVYSVLDPRGREPDRPFQAISPRLKTLSGKKVCVVNLHGGNEEVMLTIAPAIKELVPDCNAVYYSAEGRWSNLPEVDWEFIESCDAVIFGHDY
jgi:hypothetical protein